LQRSLADAGITVSKCEVSLGFQLPQGHDRPAQGGQPSWRDQAVPQRPETSVVPEEVLGIHPAAREHAGLDYFA